MCGRYADFRSAQALADAFGIDPEHIEDDVRLQPARWNVAPTTEVRIVVERAQGPEEGAGAVRSLRLARWGLVPGWAKDPGIGVKMINARSETLAEKPAFRKALAARRCLVPADGYYEWLAQGPGPKQPFWIHPADGGGVAFAGLYEFWRDRSGAEPGPWLVSTTIVTASAEDSPPELRRIHDRRPVALPAEAWAEWLDPALSDPVAALAVLAKPPPPLVPTPVGRAVSNVRNDGPELIEPLAG